MKPHHQSLHSHHWGLLQLLHIETHSRQRSHLHSQFQPVPWRSAFVWYPRYLNGLVKSWENLNRKPMGFYHQKKGFPVKIFPSSNSMSITLACWPDMRDLRDLRLWQGCCFASWVLPKSSKIRSQQSKRHLNHLTSAKHNRIKPTSQQALSSPTMMMHTSRFPTRCLTLISRYFKKPSGYDYHSHGIDGP